MSGAARTLHIALPIESDDELATLRGALLAARAAELAEVRRRGLRHSLGYGTDTQRASMTDETAHAERRHAALDRLLRAIDEATTGSADGR